MSLCHNTNSHLKSSNAVRNLTDLAITKINFMLSRCCLVMRGFNFHSHIFQCKHHISSCIFSKIQRTDIQISGLLVCHRCWISIIFCMKQEKFTFRINVAGITLSLRFSGNIFQNISWTVFIWRSIRKIQITDHSCHFSLLWTPRQDCKCIKYRSEIQICIF